MTKASARFLTTILVLSVAVSSATTSVSADWFLDRTGALISIDGSVLGDETRVGETAANERAIKEREAAKQRLEKETRARELRAPKPDNIKVDAVRSGDAAKLRLEKTARLDNGETRREKQVELKNSESLFVEREGEDPIEIKAVKERELEIKRDNIKTHTELPVSINADNELVLTKPSGETKVLTVMPDQVKTKILDQGLLPAEVKGLDETGEEKVELTENSAGEPVYKVKSVSEKRVLGLFRMKFNSETEVRATDGETTTVSEETSTWRRFLERLAR
jgi:hypothetical protein